MDRRAHLGAYLLLTVLWTWVFWWGAVALSLEWSSPWGARLFAAGGAGPLLVAAALVHLGWYPERPREYWRRLVDVRRVPPRWWAVVAAVALLPALLGRAAGSGDAWLELGAVPVLVTGLVAGLVEEPGWRGYAQDVGQRRLGPLGAALLVGSVWALWHLPLFFFGGSYQHGLGAWSETFVLYLTALVAWAVVYAWVYVGTGRSIAAVVVLHSVANGAGELIPGSGGNRLETVVLVVIACACGWALRRRGPRGARSASGGVVREGTVVR